MMGRVIADRISVIMPCFNAASFVSDAVNSVLNQSYRNVELIVVDDGSSDGSREILRALAEQHSSRLTLLLQERRGPYPARNLALRHALGGYVAFLDADDYWRQDCLEKLESALREHRADVAYCGWQNVGEGAPGTGPYIPPDYVGMDAVVEFLRGCPWPIHAALVRREALDSVGGFSERCFSAMDYDLWLKLYANTQRIVRVAEVMAFYRWHDKGQISRTRWRQVLDAWQVRRDFVADNRELFADVPQTTITDLRDGWLVREAYAAFWRRDLGDARELFRAVFRHRLWTHRDLKYLVFALLPLAWSRPLLASSDRTKERHP